jgi:hypothetical protein
MNSPKPLYKYLNGKNDRAADLITKARFMGKLNQEFLKNVPTPVNLHVQLANIHGSKLHVIADSPVWATKFRFMSSHLLPTLKKNIQYFQYLKEITVSTRPINSALHKTKVAGPRCISAEAKICLENMADSLSEGDLRQSLLRLAKQYKPQ